MSEFKFTRYFEEKVLQKRSTLRKEWCIKGVEEPLKLEAQEDNRYRFWNAVPEYEFNDIEYNDEGYPTLYIDDIEYPIHARHKLMALNSGIRDPQVDREIYASVGMWPTNNYNTSDGLGIEDNKAQGYITKSEYNDRLKSLKSKLKLLS